ncbi:MAG: TetR/AcrR family transcriptional regulator [Cyanobacteria bacterium J06598_3]
MTRETHLATLFDLFRHNGYDGVSLSKISEATGLGRASLYHHFPGGKAEMLAATLTYGKQWVEENIVQVLQADGPVEVRIDAMCDRLITLHAAGENPCLLAAVSTGAAQADFHGQIQENMGLVISAIAAALTEAGFTPTLAKQRAEDALISIEGALIVSRGLGDTRVFQRAIAQMPEMLCQGL